MNKLEPILEQAQAARDQGAWQRALDLFTQAQALRPEAGAIAHNLALCHLALGQYEQAIHASRRALNALPDLWQTQIVLAKAHQGLGAIEQADTAYQAVLRNHPQQASALTGRADLAMNFFGEARVAHELVKPLLEDPEEAMDAKLTQLMSRLYDRAPTDSGEKIAHDAIAFAQAYLQLPRHLQLSARPIKKTPKRPRVGLLSNQFCVSPVYFLTIAGWQHVAKGCEVILFNRGHVRDWATEAFTQLANEVIDVQHLSAEQLAARIGEAQINVLYDLSGWMDPIGLQALSVQPATVQYKWVGGQSLTTGLDCFAGWIGDAHQSPVALQSLYRERLINVAPAYATYTPPSYLPKPSPTKSKTPCVFSNPAKLSSVFLQYLQTLPGKKVLIHKNYRFARTRARIEEVLGSHAVEFICPNSHAEALMALNQHATMLDTFPYSSGLTAYEALALGTAITCAPQSYAGVLFAERHTARFWQQS